MDISIAPNIDGTRNSRSDEQFRLTAERESPLSVTCNWKIINNKRFEDTIFTAPLHEAPEVIFYEEVAHFHRCIALEQPTPGEPCMLEINMTNTQKIARIALVSEGGVLEIFKDDYEKTIFPQFIDEYQGNVAYFCDTDMDPPNTEVSIKFPRTRNPLWIYGIKLFLTDPMKEAKPSAFNYDKIKSFLRSNTKASEMSKQVEKVGRLFGYHEQGTTNRESYNWELYGLENFISRYFEPKDKIEETDSEEERLNCDSEIEKVDNEKERPNCENGNETMNSLEYQSGIVTKDCKNDNERTNSLDFQNGIVREGCENKCPNCGHDYKSNADIKSYIDQKFSDIEVSLKERLDQMEATTNRKLDALCKMLAKSLDSKQLDLE